MIAVATAVQPITVDLKATREHRRKLTVMYETGGNGYWWVGAYPPGKWKYGTQCIAYAGAFDAKDICIRELKDDGRFDLNVTGAAFPITRAEADQLVAAFGFEVRKL